MPDWSRKYLCDIAGVVKECARDSQGSPTVQQRFGELYELARGFSRTPQQRPANTRQVIVALCATCKETGWHQNCTGREDWRQPCHLTNTRLAKGL